VFLTPRAGIRDRKKAVSGTRDPGYGINISDHISENLVKHFWVIVSSVLRIRIRGQGGKNPDLGSGINIQDPHHWFSVINIIWQKMPRSCLYVICRSLFMFRLSNLLCLRFANHSLVNCLRYKAILFKLGLRSSSFNKALGWEILYYAVYGTYCYAKSFLHKFQLSGCTALCWAQARAGYSTQSTNLIIYFFIQPFFVINFNNLKLPSFPVWF